MDDSLVDGWIEKCGVKDCHAHVMQNRTIVGRGLTWSGGDVEKANC